MRAESTLPQQNISKHCILICNSPPYGTPVTESVSYNGMVTDQLVTLMGERGINFSIFAPRLMPFLFKLYEKSGGDVSLALSKNYAKDTRHVVLLRGFQLQERPVSPQNQQSTTPSKQNEIKMSPSPSPQGQKRPLSPSSVSSNGAIVIPNQMPVQQQIRGHPPPPPAFAQPGKAPTPDSIVRPSRGASPVPRANWPNQNLSPGTSNSPLSSASSSPNSMPVLTSQLQNLQ